MCDYSLGHLQNRLAEEGENLVLTKFSSGCKGFASANFLSAIAPKSMLNLRARPQIRECAICIPEGATLEVRLSCPQHGIEAGIHPATFRQIHPNAGSYRDALEVKGHEPILLQRFDLGVVEAKVICLGTPEHVEERTQAVEMAVYR